MDTFCSFMHNAAMNLDGIDVFVRVVQAGGFSAAARLMGIPTTTVSAKVARLEQRLGVSLIRRSTRKMDVTDAGKAYFDHCLEALDALQAGEDQLAASAAEPVGLLRVTAPPDLAQSVLPVFVQRYLDTYAKASIELVVTNAPMDLIAEGIDLAVRASPMQDSSLKVRKFVSGQLGLWAAPSYLAKAGAPETADDLHTHVVLKHSRMGPASARLVSDTGSVDPEATGRLKADDMQTLRAFAQLGAGIALLPNLPDASLVRVLPAYATAPGPVFFVYPAQRFVPLNVRAFMDLCLSTSA